MRFAAQSSSEQFPALTATGAPNGGALPLCAKRSIGRHMRDCYPKRLTCESFGKSVFSSMSLTVSLDFSTFLSLLETTSKACGTTPRPLIDEFVPALRPLCQAARPPNVPDDQRDGRCHHQDDECRKPLILHGDDGRAGV
jgi:hypothetical protein